MTRSPYCRSGGNALSVTGPQSSSSCCLPVIRNDLDHNSILNAVSIKEPDAQKLVLAAAKARGKRSTRATHGLGSLETVYLGPEYCVASLSRLGGENMGMNTQATKLQAAEDDLKKLMADVTRAMERAQEAVARITSN